MNEIKRLRKSSSFDACPRKRYSLRMVRLQENMHNVGILIIRYMHTISMMIEGRSSLFIVK
jgi:hypothetical protein